ncbi:putative scaffolding protein [Glutamicibacter phage BIM BV-113]|nr:putative scaffolding protein [Glutamicibacter phage BIM BV-113]
MALNQRYPECKHIALTATSAIASGAPVKIGQFVGVAQTSAASGEKVTVWLDGSYDLTVTGVTTEGAIVYIGSDGALSTTATGGFPFGVALGSKTAAAAEVEVAPFGKITTTAALA